MEALFAIGALIAFIIFLVRWDARAMDRRSWKKHNKPLKADPRVIALLVEHQARVDMETLAIRLLINTHPQAHQLKGVIRATAPQYVQAYSGDAPDANDMYAQSIEVALEALLMD